MSTHRCNRLPSIGNSRRMRTLYAAPLLLVATLAGGLPNSGDLLSLYAPALLAGGRHLTMTGVPSAHVLNPALSATDERLNFELGYIALLSTARNGGTRPTRSTPAPPYPRASEPLASAATTSARHWHR